MAWCFKSSLVLVALAGIFLAAPGCSAEKQSEATTVSIDEPITSDRVPAAAVLESSGEGEQSFRAPAAGKVWLFDDDRKMVLYFGDVHKGERLTVSPRLHRLTLDGRDLNVNDIFERNVHGIYFLRQGTRVAPAAAPPARER